MITYLYDLVHIKATIISIVATSLSLSTSMVDIVKIDSKQTAGDEESSF